MSVVLAIVEPAVSECLLVTIITFSVNRNPVD